jgi:hypothetical protein
MTRHHRWVSSKHHGDTRRTCLTESSSISSPGASIAWNLVGKTLFTIGYLIGRQVHRVG